MSEEVRSVGRPRKAAEYTHSALGTYQDPKSQHWKLVSFRFNPLTGDVSSDIVVLQTFPDKAEIDYRFKVAAAIELNIGG